MQLKYSKEEWITSLKTLIIVNLVHIDDILVFSKTIEQHKDAVLAVTQRCIDHGIILGKNKSIYAE